MKIIIVGINGVVGGYVYQQAKKRGYEVVAGIDVNTDNTKFDCPVYADFSALDTKVADAIVDFSFHGAVKNILDYAVKTHTPAVLSTTGYTDEELALISDASKKVAILRSGNMSLGVNTLLKLVKAGAEALYGKADVEIVEMHHNRKIDAPSGTALMIADAVKSVNTDANFVYGRQGASKRQKEDVTIHALRGGTVVGLHEVIFAMDNEVIKLSHQAENRIIFADGALDGAFFLKDKENGMYNMQDVLD